MPADAPHTSKLVRPASWPRLTQGTASKLAAPEDRPQATSNAQSLKGKPLNNPTPAALAGLTTPNEPCGPLFQARGAKDLLTKLTACKHPASLTQATLRPGVTSRESRVQPLGEPSTSDPEPPSFAGEPAPAETRGR